MFRLPFLGFDRLDGLVKRDGVHHRREACDIAAFRQVVDVTLATTVSCCIDAREVVADSSGAIADAASVLSTSGGPLVPVCTASKVGVARLTRVPARLVEVKQLR
ncbi:MAG: SDR family NAD(P)-dependent oxidoreductase [Boseongicola sp.]|nr:SDR family NAD(P)-dependent oxidoreductase [Boseongicola sp.]